MVAAQGGVDDVLDDRKDDDDCNAVDCGEEIVGDAMGVHVGGLRDEVGGHLGLAKPVNYECDAKVKTISERWNTANMIWTALQGASGCKSAFELFDESSAPRYGFAVLV